MAVPSGPLTVFVPKPSSLSLGEAMSRVRMWLDHSLPLFVSSSDEDQSLCDWRIAGGGYVWCGDGSIRLPSGLCVYWWSLPSERAGRVFKSGVGCG